MIIVVATTNLHKLSEIRKILRGSKLTLKPLSAFPLLPDVAETGATLAANAVLKARATARALKLPALADDSGLFVPALGGEPGVRSARYAGPGNDYAANNRKLLRRMRGLTGNQRRAFFATTMALALPDGTIRIRTGKVWGTIGTELRGQNGFGYDPLFFPKGSNSTYAEMTPAAKNRASHRALAARKMVAVVREELLAKKKRKKR
ncbi:MAG: RdgB/HAM1 family non-canonical purine NTP pyrophosphatase [candidate division FCPU426 bacterium]